MQRPWKRSLRWTFSVFTQYTDSDIKYIYIFTCVYTYIHWVNSDKPLKWPRLPFTIPSNKRIHFHPKKSGMFSMDCLYIWKWFKEEKAPSTCIHCLLICLSSPQIKYPWARYCLGSGVAPVKETHTAPAFLWGVGIIDKCHISERSRPSYCGSEQCLNNFCRRTLKNVIMKAEGSPRLLSFAQFIFLSLFFYGF